jgi:hypothetical protein
MLRLTGRLADGWVPSAAYLPVSELPAKTRIVDEAARRAGRDPAEIRRVYNVDGDFGLRGDALLQGPPAAWVEPLVDLVLTHGMSAFLLSVSPTATADVRRFAEEVVPAVREAVEHERRRAAEAADAAAPAVPMAVEPAPVRPDEKTGPAERPAIDGISAEGRAGQQVLIQVHDHLRNELAQLREGLAQLEAGLHDVEWMRSLLARLTVRTNGCSVGAFCAGYCRFVTLHHAIEDQRLFPDIAGADSSLEPVLARLQQEHEVIAEVIEEIDGALVAMLADPTATGPVRQAVDRLAEVLLRHLTYEEDELLGPIGRLSIVV